MSSHSSAAESTTDPETVRLIRLTGLREKEILSARSGGKESWKPIQELIDSHNRMLSLGEKHTRQKAIQDPIYGAILFKPWELDILSTWEMLRLRFVNQLGPAHIVYPGATHTRYQHCAGTNFLAQKCIRVVNYCDDIDSPCFIPLSNLFDDYQQKIFRAAALLHDVGHPPTSHSIEFALESWANVNHIDLGEHQILLSGLSETLEQNDIEPTTIIDVLRRRSNDPVFQLISDFLDHPLDIDKTDYLIRDAHFSGVQLGIFPAERVMLTNRVVRDKDGRYIRGFMLKAMHSLESLILSRNWMFSDLYLHHAVKLAEALISKATYFRMREENFTRNECLGFFTRMTDADLYRWLEESEIPFVKDYVARIRYRRLYKVVLARPIATFDEDTQKEFLSLLHDIEKLIAIETEIAGDPGQVIIDVVNPEFGDKTLGQIPLLVGGENSGIEIVSLEDIEEGRPLMKILRQQQKTIPSVRVYADSENSKKIRKSFNERFSVKDESRTLHDEYDMTET
ncbi:MAG: HD domain-containing protein [Candidatus Hodarchaeota archaeon]